MPEFEVFYDSHDRLQSLDSESGIGLWSNELISVNERRGAFLYKMGLIDSHKSESLPMELHRISEITGVVVSSSPDSTSPINETVQNPILTDRDDESEMELTVDHTVSVSPQKVNRHWWKKLLSFARKSSKNSNSNSKAPVKVHCNRKRLKELSALYTGQEFKAHNGVVWTAKFSPNGNYLATGGQDGVLRVWCVTSTDSVETPFVDHEKISVPVSVPDRVFQINETPLHEFKGHQGDILGLSWSNSNNMILSSSTDCSVRLWQVGSDECVSVFHHPDFVTCVQFNPISDGFFVTGSIDGKIRVWGVSEGRVIEWDDAREAVSAVSYQPNGQGLVVGLLNGMCRLYEAQGSSLQLSERVQIMGCRRSSGSRITGIQFCPRNPERVMVTSEDSKIRVFDKTNLIKKYRGLPKSGTQTSASFTPSRRHILSVGEDSRVYLWDYENEGTQPPSKHTKSNRCCEYFNSQGVSVALTWASRESAHAISSDSRACANPRCSEAQGALESECVSLAKWFSIDGSSRVTATWPEEMLPSREEQESWRSCRCDGPKSPTWGLVIVTASCDGMIRVFRNFGVVPTRA